MEEMTRRSTRAAFTTSDKKYCLRLYRSLKKYISAQITFIAPDKL
jgi:hypothetical protein